MKISIIRCFASRLYLKILQKIFKFDSWHVMGNMNCRTYKREALILTELISPASVVELGCGLGDLVSNVKAVKKIGIDISSAAINAARYINGGKCEFIVGSFDQVEKYSADLLIMVNWIHDVSPEILNEKFQSFANKYRYLLVDVITVNRSEYKYKHDFDKINLIGRLVKKVDCGKREGRSLLLYEFT